MLQFVGCLVVAMGVSFVFCTPCQALKSDEVLVLANLRNKHSLGIATYYMKQRNVPGQNLIKLWVTDQETCSRGEYEDKIAAPLRRKIAANDLKKRIRCIVVTYGFPLKVNPTELNDKESEELRLLNLEKENFEKQLTAMGQGQVKNPGQVENIEKDISQITKRITVLKRSDELSSLDSELALVCLSGYSLSGWVLNPFYLGFRNSTETISKNNVLMVSRLDGPTPDAARRIIDDSLRVENAGLRGIAYFDARWPQREHADNSAYAYYDRSIHLAAETVKKRNLLKVIVDDREELFQPGNCPNAALYCGWYSLAKYIDAFKWVPGAVGYHIASSECTTLKNRESEVWCKMMIEKGAAATIGPVAEPYVNAFPLPELFFGFLVDGYLSLAECYMISTPYLSWRMVLIGDPLYMPFKNIGE